MERLGGKGRPAAAGGTAARRRRSLGEALSPSHNSLNFMRLFFALVVIMSHTVVAGGFKAFDRINQTASGTLAVFGFFAISGYLIARSAARHSAGRYLWQRFLRIFPGFWVCLLVTAFVFGPIAWFAIPHAACGSFSCYLHAPSGPIGYIYRNFLLHMNQVAISGTPTGRIFPLFWASWNGSLWTLFYEFLCYLIVLGLALVGLLRHRAATLVITSVAFLATVYFTAESRSLVDFNVYHNYVWMTLLKFVVVFLAGSLAYLYEDVIPDSGLLALGCTVLFFASMALPNGKGIPGFNFTYSTMFFPLMVYPVLWLGAHLPLQRVGTKNDYSYGIYIYAFPVQQLFAIWRLNRWGYLAYLGLVVLGTVPLALASWWGIEKRALRLKTLRRRAPAVALAAVPAAEGAEP
jgi:peptidoglycan/LPS O-acetylase OafA/YrhL